MGGHGVGTERLPGLQGRREGRRAEQGEERAGGAGPEGTGSWLGWLLLPTLCQVHLPPHGLSGPFPRSLVWETPEVPTGRTGQALWGRRDLYSTPECNGGLHVFI